VDLKENNDWPKAITVDKRIVRILSSSTYSNFPSAIREVIVNSYDADASTVKVDFDIKNSIISIIDNGKGMNEDDFTFYLRIAGKSRKKEETTTKNKRKIIGQFGVGFLSVLPFCERYLIETTKKGSSEVVTATITSSEYFKDDSKSIDVDKIPIDGGVKIDPSKNGESYTRIRLVGFSKLTKAFLNREYTLDGKRNTIKKSEPLELLKWELQEYLPIDYELETAIGKKLNRLSIGYSQNRFQVFFNNQELYRNIHASKILDFSESSIEIGNIKFKYFISTDYSPINPTEARYILIRNLNIGVGERTSFGIGMDGKVYGKLAHLTGEILVEEGLNELISVARDKFNYSVEYEKLKDFFRGKLRHFANELDTIKGVEKFIEDFQDEKKVSDLNNLKDDVITKKLEKLESSGFEVIKNDTPSYHSDNIQEITKSSIKVDKLERKVHLNIYEDQIYKRISVSNKKYKLKIADWDYSNSEFPAIQIDGDIVIVNEDYPLFKDKNQVDVFIKLNILLLQNLKENKIDNYAYQGLMQDLLNTFNA